MRNAASRLLVVAAVVVCSVLVAFGAAAAPNQDDAEDTSSTTVPEGDSIIPEPNSGRSPEDAGDRGGWLQTGVFLIVVAGVGVIGALVVRESRRKRAERGF